MQNQTIEISIRPDGRVTYTIKGVQGNSCESISALLEQLGKVEHEERTDDYYAQNAEGHVVVSNG